MEVGTQSLGKKPRGDMKVLVVGLRQPLAPGARFFESRRDIRNAITGGKRSPAASYQFALIRRRVIGRLRCRTHLSSQGTIAVLISLPRFINFSKTRFSS